MKTRKKKEMGRNQNAQPADNRALEYDRRLACHLDELKWLYCELYPGQQGAFEDLRRNLKNIYLSRKEELKVLDREREKNPGWYKKNDILGMMMYVDAFAGDLNGVREKMDYVQECGVNYLHLMPLLASPAGKSDGGYAVSDFRTVEPRLGTMEDLEHLADVCRARKISLCLDFVMNHTSEDHEWAKKARAGERRFPLMAAAGF